MNTRTEIVRENWIAAKILRGRKCPRSCISRAYYAVYCALTAALLEKGVAFARGRPNPAHEQIPRSLNCLWREAQLSRNKRTVRRLYAARLHADYFQAYPINDEIARDSMRDAAFILRALGVREK